VPKRTYSRSFAWIIVLAALVGLSLVVLGCGDAGSGTTGSVSETSSGKEAPKEGAGEGRQVDAATEEAVVEGYKGTWTEAPSAPTKVASGKQTWIVTIGQASPTAKALVDSITEATKTMGWSSHLCDAKLEAPQAVRCWEEAITNGAEGIVGVSTDCPSIKAQLEKAKAAGIATVPVYSWDCNEVEGGAPSLYSDHLGFGKRFGEEGLTGFDKAAGRTAAAWIASGTGGNGKVINSTNKEVYSLKFYQEGFAEGLAQYCPSCSQTEVPYLLSEFGTKLQAKTQAALAKEPEANAVQASLNPGLGNTQAVIASGRAEELAVVGGLGLSIDTDLIHEDAGLDAVVGVPLEWMGYAAVDAMNSGFEKSPVRDSGLGYGLIDKDHNLPELGENFASPVNFKSAFEESWGK
jgi:ribose transport system substrate-binding protein